MLQAQQQLVERRTCEAVSGSELASAVRVHDAYSAAALLHVVLELDFICKRLYERHVLLHGDDAPRLPRHGLKVPLSRCAINAEKSVPVAGVVAGVEGAPHVDLDIVEGHEAGGVRRRAAVAELGARVAGGCTGRTCEVRRPFDVRECKTLVVTRPLNRRLAVVECAMQGEDVFVLGLQLRVCDRLSFRRLSQLDLVNVR